MASYTRRKESLRAAALAYLAGAHCITVEVEKAHELRPIESAAPLDYGRVPASGSEGVGLLCDMLEEEELYPFGSEWPREALTELLTKLIPPEPDALKFRFKKGFKELLSGLAAGLGEGGPPRGHGLDHWLALLLNTAFYAGATIAARMAENPKSFFATIEELESETEPWSRYPQLVNVYERQLRRETRRKTGLVTDLDLE